MPIARPARNDLPAAWHEQARRPAARGAFTLIELLVVIAIIALLVGILVPTVVSARNSARLAVCLSQQRSIATAWMLYLEDSKEFFPVWKMNLQRFYGGKEPCVYSLLNPKYALPWRPVNPYVDRAMKNESSAEIFRCPADRGIPNLTGGYTAYDYYGNSYMMNDALLSKVDPVTGIVLVPYQSVCAREVKTPPSRVVLQGDTQWYYSVNAAAWDANFHNRDNRVNLVFLDGHAALTQIVPHMDITPDYCFPIWQPPDPP